MDEGSSEFQTLKREGERDAELWINTEVFDRYRESSMYSALITFHTPYCEGLPSQTSQKQERSCNNS